MSSEGFQGNGNGHRINWAAARAYWLALEPEKRSYQAVAERFGVTRQRVGQVARANGWPKALEELEELEEKTEMREIRRAIVARARSRGERVARTLELYDRASDLGLELLPLTDAGELDLAAIAEIPNLDTMLQRLPALFRMAELAAGEATENVAIVEIQPILIALSRVAIRNAPAERREAVLGELEEAMGGLLTIEAGPTA